MKKKGVGISCVLHPSGLPRNGDPCQAAIQLKPDGTFALLVGAVDLGQGSTTILRQFAADALDVPIDSIFASNFTDGFAPLCAGSLASRVTLVYPHAVVNAAEDLKAKIKKFVAPNLEAPPELLEVAQNKVFIKDYPEQSLTMAEVGNAVNWGGEFLVGTGAWMTNAIQYHDPETGKMTAINAISFGACVAEVEVDTETGEVTVLKLAQVWEVGKAVNPLLVKGQINGGLNIGLGLCLTENMYPYYPKADFIPEMLGDYFVPSFADYPLELLAGIAEVPHPKGVKGAKGFSEGSAAAAPPAVLSAIHDAVGVWITEYPATPEVILRALEAAKAEEVINADQ